jgi:hypothetical protein
LIGIAGIFVKTGRYFAVIKYVERGKRIDPIRVYNRRYKGR